jgi:hypothetical protein
VMFVELRSATTGGTLAGIAVKVARLALDKLSELSCLATAAPTKAELTGKQPGRSEPSCAHLSLLLPPATNPLPHGDKRSRADSKGVAAGAVTATNSQGGETLAPEQGSLT